MESVQGQCPACGWKGLFLGEGGYVTCSQSNCTDPTLAADLLDMGTKLNDLAHSGAQVHHIQGLRDQLAKLIGKEPFPEDFAAFMNRLLVGRDPQVDDGGGQ